MSLGAGFFPMVHSVFKERRKFRGVYTGSYESALVLRGTYQGRDRVTVVDELAWTS